MAASDLLEWLTTNGGYLHPEVAIAEDVENGLHFKAQADVHGGDICRCPTSLSMSILNATSDGNTLAAHLLKYRDKHITIQTISYVFLVEQRLLEDESFWSPYIRSLPKEDDLTLPLYFDADEMQWLEGTNLHRAVEERRKQWRDDWQKALNVLERQGLEYSKISWYVNDSGYADGHDCWNTILLKQRFSSDTAR